MAACVQRTAAAWKPDLVFGITFVMAPYALSLAGMRRVLDVDNLLANMLYEAYRQAPSTTERMRRYLAYWKFQRYEHQLFQQFDLGLVVSEADAQQVRQALPAHAEHVGLAPNGVDLETHHPGAYLPQEDQLVFSGALTYAPNFDAMQFFIGEILPAIQQEQPDATLLITGKTEGVSLERLPKCGGVVFTGYLDDIRPTVASSTVCVVPLRMGAGTRLKILEAMALGTPVVSTAKGAEGLAVAHGTHLLIADQPQDFARQTLRLLKDPELRQHLAQNAYRLIQERYDWRAIGQQLSDLVEQVARRGARES
jgi:glycosyltransferase involved in cell wall biosynthesis